MFCGLILCNFFLYFLYDVRMEQARQILGGYLRFLFIGLLLSLLFMIFLALVIYYKQITEGYSDRYNFEVMQKVGIDRNEVSAIVHKEIRTMFFLPLLIAVIHLAVSLYAVAMLLAVFGLTKYGKEASNRKQQIDRQQPAIPYFFLNLLKNTCL